MNTQKNMEERFAKEMEARSVYYEPKGSPWGEVQTYRYLSKGVFFVSTASHGGVIVLKELADRYFTKEAQACCFPYGNYLCFEEDCDAPVAVRELMDKGIMKAPVNEYYKRRIRGGHRRQPEAVASPILAGPGATDAQGSTT